MNASFRAVLAAGLLSGCTMGITLTDRGTQVQRVSSSALPGGCEILGDVPIGLPPDAAHPRTEEQLVILMRNKAGQMGATHVLVESTERRGQGDDRHYVGRGRAYACPEDRREIDEPPAIQEPVDDERPPADDESDE